VDIEARHGSLLRAALARLLGDGDVPPPVSFGDGLQALPEALYEEHRQYVHLDTPVDGVRDGEGGGYTMDVGSRSMDVDVVVVTTPAPPAAGLLADVANATVEPLSALTYNSLALVHLQADVDVEGFGYQVQRDESPRTLGVTWNDALFDRGGVATAFLGGMDDPDVLDLPADEIGAIARREFATVMGVEPSVLDVTKLPEVLPAYDTTWEGLGAVSLPDDVVLATNYTDRVGIGARVRQARRLADRLAERA
jgi:oxygen-dependent protoporphyrinogen oxidase